MRNYSIKSCFALMPNDSHKSFYGKARVYDTDAGLVLVSYSTPVAAFVNGRFIRLWSGYSATTQRHVNAFAAYCGLRDSGKKWFASLPVETI